ncbi:MAG: ribosome biogenesis GTPase YlqF [Prochlorotrichaceae cyanobacterium]|jgi:ribosome biogenesis GTPase A
MSTPEIQWYPGHIAKAERQLLEQLNRVDAVLEVRDARIPLATRHPQIDRWLGPKERVLVLNRMDMIPPAVQTAWLNWFEAQGDVALLTDAQQGKGVQLVSRVAQAAGSAMNDRRQQRGMQPRAVRVVVIGFPNVGKSALINRLLKRRVVESARRPGVTRQLRWVRIGASLDLLDAPGVLPSKLTDQNAALKLAFCDDIGEAAYDTQRVAAALLDHLKALEAQSHLVSTQGISDRYGLPLSLGSGETYLHELATQKFQNDRERVAQKLLNDFRKGFWGPLPLELPPP